MEPILRFGIARRQVKFGVQCLIGYHPGTIHFNKGLAKKWASLQAKLHS